MNVSECAAENVSGIAAYLAALLKSADLKSRFLVKDVSLNLSNGGRFSLFAWSSVPDNYETFSGYGETFDEAVNDFASKADPIQTAAQSRRAQAAKLLAEAEAIEAAVTKATP